MKTSSVNHPTREPLVVVHLWQLVYCDGNSVAAGLMSYLEYWHNIKLDIFENNPKKSGEPTERDLLQHHTHEQLVHGIIRLAKDPKTINAALEYLEAKGVISIMLNPNKNFGFDRTRHFLFHPEVANEWLAEVYANMPDELKDAYTIGKNPKRLKTQESGDSETLPDTNGKNPKRVGKNPKRVGKNPRTIPETTTETTKQRTTGSTFSDNSDELPFVDPVYNIDSEYDSESRFFKACMGVLKVSRWKLRGKERSTWTSLLHYGASIPAFADWMVYVAEKRLSFSRFAEMCLDAGAYQNWYANGGRDVPVEDEVIAAVPDGGLVRGADFTPKEQVGGEVVTECIQSFSALTGIRSPRKGSNRRVAWANEVLSQIDEFGDLERVLRLHKEAYEILKVPFANGDITLKSPKSLTNTMRKCEGRLVAQERIQSETRVDVQWSDDARLAYQQMLANHS